jgi:single-stranded-DNA-specific exonuclease
LGEENLKKGLSLIVAAVAKDEDTIIVVDCDTDGYTSAAILINYLYKLFPTWVNNHLRWIMHEGKQHGLSDCIDYILSQSPALVLLPDSSSNDYELHAKLKEAKI